MIQLSAPGRDGAVLEFSDPDSATDHGYAEGWTDGLPFLLPTTGRVDGLLAAVGGDPERPLGAGRWPGLTARAVAWNAALGGCSPAHVPVLLAAVEALTDPLFGLDRLLQATSAWAPLAIVSGPAVRALGFNSRDGVFGGGSRANVAVGRTIRLLLWNVMGARGGPAFGHPGAASFCIAEDPDANPWEPFHTTVAGGVEGAGSAVTVFACEANHNVCDTHNDRPERLLDTIVDGLSTLGNRVTQAGGETLVVAGPERARVFAAEGWSRAAVQRYIYERARRRPADVLRAGGSRPVPAWIDADSACAGVAVFDSPADVLVLVAGGDGPHSVVCPGAGAGLGRAVARAIPKSSGGVSV